MSVSLITTVRDEAASVGALAAAVAAQTRRPDEWVVVDGGSRDDTPGRLRAAAAALDLPLRLEVVRGNIAFGRNAAVDAASGSVVVVTDAGCVPERRWLETLVAPLENGACDVAAGLSRARVRSSFDVAQWTLLDQLHGARPTWRGHTLSSRSLAFRRDLARACPYPEWLDHGEDRWLIEEWRRRGAAIHVVEEPDAAVWWDLRASAGAFLAQHFRYMRGDGLGGLRGGRHALRFAYYGALALAAALGHPVVAASLWAAYCGTTVGVRWPEAARGTRAPVRLRSLPWIPPLLAAMDLAKMAGYLAGRVERATTPA
jgi:glycosyltransferase involved in cell wall biosynthesis